MVKVGQKGSWEVDCEACCNVSRFVVFVWSGWWKGGGMRGEESAVVDGDFGAGL